MTPQQTLTKELNSLQEDLLKKYQEKGMESSGDWGRSLETQISSSKEGLTGVILGNDYTQQLELGRKPGRFPPREAIENWIKEKGIAAKIEGEISVSSLAFLIARKIAREGWDRKKYGGVDLVSDVVTPKRIQNIVDAVGQSYVVAITTGIIKSFKEINLA